jgi:hypothetical protein
MSLHLPLERKLGSGESLRRGCGQRLSVWISSSTTTSAALTSSIVSPVVPLLVWSPKLEARHIYSSSVSECVFCQAVGMCFNLVRFEIHLGIEYHELLL